MGSAVFFVDHGKRSDRSTEVIGKDRQAAEKRKRGLINQGAQRVKVRAKSIFSGTCSIPPTNRICLHRVQRMHC